MGPFCLACASGGGGGGGVAGLACSNCFQEGAWAKGGCRELCAQCSAMWGQLGASWRHRPVMGVGWGD